MSQSSNYWELPSFLLQKSKVKSVLTISYYNAYMKLMIWLVLQFCRHYELKWFQVICCPILSKKQAAMISSYMICNCVFNHDCVYVCQHVYYEGYLCVVPI